MDRRNNPSLANTPPIWSWVLSHVATGSGTSMSVDENRIPASEFCCQAKLSAPSLSPAGSAKYLPPNTSC
jgi:hypothetical protein